MTEGWLGHYRIDRQLGAGGMGVVYLAFDTDLQRPVAIKTLLTDPEDDRARKRILTEARAASALNHPHICTIYSVSQAGEQPYIVMEYVEGKPLCEVLPADGFPIATCIQYSMQITDALMHAHERGIVHRDLKSANIMVTPQGRVKVLDFGLAKRIDAADLEALPLSRQMTAEQSSVAGTIAYMAPEILLGEPAGPRSDIWSLGVVLFELASGAMPFTGRTAAEITTAIFQTRPHLPPRVAPMLASIIDRCLAKQVSSRYQRVSEVQEALEQCRSSLASLHVPKHLADQILKSRQRLEGERKQVTVLQCHLVDAAVLADNLGPDVMHGFLDRFFQCVVDEVHRYEGTVNQFLADGVVALFGAPLVHEDDARRALLAALEIQKRVGALRQELPAALASGLAVQIGVNTGPVIVGRIADNLRMDYTAVGETTSLAALLQQVAEPGSILLSEATRRVLHEQILTEPLELPVRPKGTSPVAHRLLGLAPIKSTLEGRLRRTFSQFVGREREVQTLQDLLEQTLAGQGQVVGIVGDAGIGKSRLVHEFCQTLSGLTVGVLEGRCISYGMSIPYLPLLELVRGRLGIEQGDSPTSIAQKIDSIVRELALATEARPCLQRLLGIGENGGQPTGLSPEALKAQNSAVLRQLVLRANRAGPSIVLIEDLHWIDRTSEEFLTSLVEALAGQPVLLLTTYRPGYQPPWMDRSYATQITLRPLMPRDSMKVVQSVLQDTAVGSGVSSNILGKAEGNPFFLEELARAILERGEEGQVIPDTVQGVIAARIDRLPEMPKRLLQTASVLGREVSVKLLRRTWDGPTGIEHDLSELRRLEFLYDRAGGEEPAVVFRHALTQEFAYASLLGSRRQILHAAAAAALEQLYADRLDEVTAALAFHYARTDQSDKAIRYLVRVADQAARVYANAEAIARLEEALNHLRRLPDNVETDRHVLDVVLRYAHSLYFLGRFRESVDRLLQEQHRLKRLQDPSLAGPYYFWLAHMYSRLGDQNQAVENAHRAIDQALRVQDEVTMGKAHGLLSLEGHWSGKTAEGLEHGEQAIAILERTDQHWWLGMAYYYMALNYLVRGRFEQALAAAAQARATGQLISDPRLGTYADFTSGWIHASRGETRLAIEVCARGVRNAPDPVSRVYAVFLLAYGYLENGDLIRAAAHLESAVSELGRFGFRQFHGFSAVLLAETYRLSGKLGEAAELATRGLELASNSQYRYAIGFAHRTLGRIALDQKRVQDAEESFRKADHTFAAIDCEFEKARTHLDMARAAGAANDWERVTANLEQARRTFERLQVPIYIERTAALAIELGISMDPP